jgi:hypothetical protein
MPSNRQASKRAKWPPLVKLVFGRVYCELCKGPIVAGELVAWWVVRDSGGRTRRTAYCAECHHASARHGSALR